MKAAAAYYLSDPVSRLVETRSSDLFPAVETRHVGSVVGAVEPSRHVHSELAARVRPDYGRSSRWTVSTVCVGTGRSSFVISFSQTFAET
jgi:hypothetical protein